MNFFSIIKSIQFYGTQSHFYIPKRKNMKNTAAKDVRLKSENKKQEKLDHQKNETSKNSLEKNKDFFRSLEAFSDCV